MNVNRVHVTMNGQMKLTLENGIDKKKLRNLCETYGFLVNSSFSSTLGRKDFVTLLLGMNCFKLLYWE